MPTVSARRTLDAPPDEVWRLVSDPERLPAWWPRVTRVEEASEEAWTSVLTSPRGKSVRADYTRVEAEPWTRLSWRQELAESPFERILAESVTSLSLERANGGTSVELTLRQRSRGFARFGWVQLRRAAARQVDEALDALEAIFASEPA